MPFKKYSEFLLEFQGGQAAGKLEIERTPVATAVDYARGVLGDSLDQDIPDFSKNYQMLQANIKAYSLGKRRAEMPVITPNDIKDFKTRLEKGLLDVNKPFALGQANAADPEDLIKSGYGTQETWLILGTKDGNKTDDKTRVSLKRVAVKDMRPIQTQIYLDKVIGKYAKFGVPKSASPILNKTMIASKDGYIIDGHHRWAQIYIADPSLKISTMVIDLPIRELLRVSLDYGDSIGNKRNL